MLLGVALAEMEWVDISIMEGHVKIEQRPNMVDATLSESSVNAPVFAFMHKFVAGFDCRFQKRIQFYIVQLSRARFLCHERLPFLPSKAGKEVVLPKRIGVAIREKSFTHGLRDLLSPAEMAN